MDKAPAPGSLQVQVAFDRDERNAAHVAAARRGPWLRRPELIYPVAVAAGVVIVPAAQALQHLILPAASWQASVVGSVLVMVATAFSIVVWTGRQRGELERHEAHPDTYTVSDEGLEISGAEDLELMSWSSMTRVHETDRFFLFVAGSEVQYLPKRVLAASQIEFVRSAILRNRRPALPRAS